VHCGWDP